MDFRKEQYSLNNSKRIEGGGGGGGGGLIIGYILHIGFKQSYQHLMQLKKQIATYKVKLICLHCRLPIPINCCIGGRHFSVILFVLDIVIQQIVLVVWKCHKNICKD